MKLTDLDPRWLAKDGSRIGFIFRCPNPERSKWWLTCFAVPTKHIDQCNAVEAEIGTGFNWLPCAEVGWTIAGGIDAATFETMTVQPSLDAGSTLWHGHITNGEIVGGLPV